MTETGLPHTLMQTAGPALGGESYDEMPIWNQLPLPGQVGYPSVLQHLYEVFHLLWHSIYSVVH